MKKLFFIILIVFLSANILSAQQADTLISDIQQVDTLSAVEDTAAIQVDNAAKNIDITDPADAVFSDKMDSLFENWDIKNKFGDISGMETGSLGYPRNLPDSVYVKRLQDMEQIIDMSYNQTVKNYMKMYTERSRNRVEVMLGLSAYYFPIFEEILDKYDMPLELKYLVIVESALNPMARSHAGANGLWQFVYGTGKNMGLEINSFVDERRDPVKATDAAARYFKKLYDIYGDWQLAIAAYNCGPGNVNRAIRRSGGKKNYWEIYYRLPRETRGYVPAFIAASYTFHYYKEHNLVPRYPDISLSVDTLMISQYLHFNQIAAKINISKEQLRALNPMFRCDVIPAKKDKPYPLVLPNDLIFDFIDNDTAIFACDREKYFPSNTLVKPSYTKNSYYTPVDVKGKAKVYYTVKSGDNVGFISSWFHVRSADLRYWNNIRRNLIREGQKLVVYVPEKSKSKYQRVNSMSFAQKQASIGKSATPASKPEAKPVDSNYQYYTVRKGDTLWDIAKKYAGISANEIMQLNGLKNDRGLYIGQKLKIRRKA